MVKLLLREVSVPLCHRGGAAGVDILIRRCILSLGLLVVVHIQETGRFEGSEQESVIVDSR